MSRYFEAHNPTGSVIIDDTSQFFQITSVSQIANDSRVTSADGTSLTWSSSPQYTSSSTRIAVIYRIYFTLRDQDILLGIYPPDNPNCMFVWFPQSTGSGYVLHIYLNQNNSMDISTILTDTRLFTWGRIDGYTTTAGLLVWNAQGEMIFESGRTLLDIVSTYSVLYSYLPTNQIYGQTIPDTTLITGKYAVIPTQLAVAWHNSAQGGIAPMYQHRGVTRQGDNLMLKTMISFWFQDAFTYFTAMSRWDNVLIVKYPLEGLY